MGKRKTKTPRLGDLAPAPYNPREITAAGRDGLATSLQEFGDISGITWNQRTGNLVAGHQRLAALRDEHGDKLRMRRGIIYTPTGERFRVRVVDWPIEKEKAANVAANNPLLGGTFTDDLVDLLDDVYEDHAAPLLFDELLAELNLVEYETAADDDVPEPPKRPTTKTGDLWRLGDHRLVCGDATDKHTVGRCLNGAAPTLMVTDPPYGVAYDPAWRVDTVNPQGFAAKMRQGEPVANDETVDWRQAFSLFPGAIAYVWHAAWFAAPVQMAIVAAGFRIRSQIIWRKPSVVVSRGHYHWQHEPCWYAVRHGATAAWAGDRKQSTIWDIAGFNPAGRSQDAADEKTGHSAQKPVEVMARPMRNHGPGGVYDPFLGTGTTIIAATKHERACYAVELEPRYCDVTVQRWQELTGRKARRHRGR